MSSFLLDTQIIIWMVLDPGRLSSQVAQIITARPPVLVSAASLWELETKRQMGKLDVTGDLRSVLVTHRFEELAVTWEHALHVAALPLIHRDPFDRILAAQAMAENLTLVTADRALARYPIRTVF